jgi:hypothetical protein
MGYSLSRFGLDIHIRSTRKWRNPKKQGHLRVPRRGLFYCHAFTESGWDLGSQTRPVGGFERDIRGESQSNQGLRFSQILVITPAQADEASRVLHPPRSSASGCSAKGRSATRSDSQRSHRRTRWDGHPAWGSKPRLHLALPSGESANRWQVKEERRQQCHDLG